MDNHLVLSLFSNTNANLDNIWVGITFKITNKECHLVNTSHHLMIKNTTQPIIGLSFHCSLFISKGRQGDKEFNWDGMLYKISDTVRVQVPITVMYACIWRYTHIYIYIYIYIDTLYGFYSTKTHTIIMSWGEYTKVSPLNNYFCTTLQHIKLI